MRTIFLFEHIFSLIKGSIRVRIITAAGKSPQLRSRSWLAWHRDSLAWSICAEKHRAHCNGSMFEEFPKAVETNKPSCGFDIKSSDCSVLWSMWSLLCNTCSHSFCAMLPPLQDWLKYSFGKIEMSFLFMLFLAMLLSSDSVLNSSPHESHLNFVPKLRNCNYIHRHRKKEASEVFLFAIHPCNSRGSNYRCLLTQDLRGAKDVYILYASSLMQ